MELLGIQVMETNTKRGSMVTVADDRNSAGHNLGDLKEPSSQEEEAFEDAQCVQLSPIKVGHTKSLSEVHVPLPP